MVSAATRTSRSSDDTQHNCHKLQQKQTSCTSIRKHALQLQFPRQNGQASAISASDILGYLRFHPQKNVIKKKILRKRKFNIQLV